jgi:hypothetical protein
MKTAKTKVINGVTVISSSISVNSKVKPANYKSDVKEISSKSAKNKVGAY